MERAIKNNKNVIRLVHSLSKKHKLSENEVRVLIANSYDSICFVINKLSTSQEVNDLRKLFHSKSYKELDDPVVDAIVREAVRRNSEQTSLPILLNKRITDYIVRTELKLINKHFNNYSLSRMLRHFSVAASFMTNAYIRQRTLKKLRFLPVQVN